MKALTLIEVCVSLAIFTLVVVGITSLNTGSLNLFTLTDKRQSAWEALRRQAELMHNVGYSTISSGTFIPDNLDPADAAGYIKVNVISVDRLKDVFLSISYKDKNRIVGEDIDLDGRLDMGEDINGNGLLDSPVSVSFSITN
ncbi:MAG: hypothetical protein PHP69_06550 [Candidatus Omnitrophica bacterium]|jgi:Tfp pilus assembly protein PilW|nr:hypothetical protein [Candidatus Omnitrophota bacterium]MDD5081545.1 hypothetical protein [Candidatus Omnitrophota bacterium]MDD5440952.1 hypothetical protein [Candidatus Omnitrophota bacterium]